MAVDMPITVPWTYSYIVTVPDDNTDITFALDIIGEVGGPLYHVDTWVTSAVRLTTATSGGASDDASSAASVHSRPSSHFKGHRIHDSRPTT